MKKMTVLFLVTFLLASCSGDVEPDTYMPEPAPVTETLPAPQSSPLVDVPALDKWALWTDGTQLRGANIYQRRVVIDLDGTDFMGVSAVGPPYTQSDFDALADTGANYVNISAPGLFTVKPPYVLDEAV